MKPYYVLACVGPEDETGAPTKFGVLGADSPAEAEGLVRQVAEMHRQRGESVELCVLQSYRTYPANLLKALAEAELKARLLLEKVARHDKELQEQYKLGSKRIDELTRQISELTAKKSRKKKATKKKTARPKTQPAWKLRRAST